jgi:AbrB family looped-hinge helix DNA binding protein
MRHKGVVTIPQEVRDQLHLSMGDRFFVRVEDGNVILVLARLVPADQAWFWSQEWQAKEREAEVDLANGDSRRFDSDEDFVAFLTEHVDDPVEQG